MNRILIAKLVAVTLVLTITISVWAFSAVSAGAAASLPAVEPVSGALVYANNCARCHGDDGEGDKGPAINTPEKQKKFRSNTQALIQRISNGRGKMPKFSTRLSAAEIRAVANFVKTL
jgi:mono/diheme cytochrome c family protein